MGALGHCWGTQMQGSRSRRTPLPGGTPEPLGIRGTPLEKGVQCLVLPQFPQHHFAQFPQH